MDAVCVNLSAEYPALEVKVSGVFIEKCPNTGRFSLCMMILRAYHQSAVMNRHLFNVPENISHVHRMHRDSWNVSLYPVILLRRTMD